MKTPSVDTPFLLQKITLGELAKSEYFGWIFERLIFNLFGEVDIEIVLEEIYVDIEM